LGQGICEGVLNCGVPVLAEYCKALIRNGSTKAPLFDSRTNAYLAHLKELTRHNAADNYGLDMPIPLNTRHSFALAFNITVEDQLRMERSLRSWTINYAPAIYVPNLFDPLKWEFTVDSLVQTDP
jgi:hypothetical protein